MNGSIGNKDQTYLLHIQRYNQMIDTCNIMHIFYINTLLMHSDTLNLLSSTIKKLECRKVLINIYDI